MTNEEIQKALNKNLEYTKKVHEEVFKIRRYILWLRILSIIKLLLIIIPLFLAIMLATPFVREAFQTYKEIMNSLRAAGNGDPSELLNNFLQ